MKFSLTVIAAVLCSSTLAYAPDKGKCPHKESLLRTAKGISCEEEDWVFKRQLKTRGSYAEFLKDSNLEDFDDIDALLCRLREPVTLGAAFSGGGYRAMLNGAGQLAALDSRVEGAKEHGLGGLLDSLTYISGLSGGSWLLSSVVLHGWKSIEDIVNENVWNLTSTILAPSDDTATDAEYYEKLFEAALAKKKAGFEISFIDIWGLALAYQLFPSDSWDRLTWSDVQHLGAFANQDMPFPIIETVSGPPGANLSALDVISTEFNPFEFGSWHRYVNSFTDLKYFGTQVEDGRPTAQCTTGFDNAAFVIGSSSDVYASTGVQSLEGLVEEFSVKLEYYIDQLNPTYDAYAINEPSPFYKFANSEDPALQSSNVLLSADGGTSDEVIPLEPLIQPVRGVSAILAFDSSADTTDHWPDGESLYFTYKRIQTYDNGSIPFPVIPTPETFISEGLNKKPTFFGCGDETVPVVVYLPNYAVSYASNYSTATLEYTNGEQMAMIKNGFEGATMNNLTDDASYRACIACATLARTLQRNHESWGPQCEKCFQSYCYN